MDLWNLLRTVRKRKWTFILVTLASFLAAVLFPRPEPPPVQYVSTAKVLLTPQNLGPGSIKEPISGVSLPSGAWFYNEVTLKELLTSQAFLEQVLHKLNQSKKPNDWLEFRARIDLKPLSERASSIFLISVAGDNPEEAQREASVVVVEFVEYVQQLSSQEFASTRRYLEEFIVQADQRIKKTETALEELTSRQPSQDETDQLARQRLDLEAEISTLSQARASLKAEIEELQSAAKGGSTPWQVLEQKDPALGSLSEELSKEQQKLLELQKVYQDTNLEVVTQRQRVADQQRLYRSKTDAAIQSLLQDKASQLKQKEAQLTANQSRLKSLVQKRVPNSERLQTERLKRQLELNQEGYLELVRQLNQARIAELVSRRQGAVSILEQPLPGKPLGATSPARTPWKQLLLALPFCILLGMAATLLAENLQASLRLQPRIEQAMGLPVLAVIPELPKELTEAWDEVKEKAVRRPPN